MLNNPGFLWGKALDRLSEQDRSRILSRLQEHEYPANSWVFHTGDPCSSLYVVKKGLIRLCHVSENGEEYTVGMWADGYIIGLITSILGHQRFLSAECLEPTVLQVLPRRDLLELMDALPGFSTNIAYLMAYMAMNSLVDSGPLALETADVRLCKLLLRLVEGPEHLPGPAGQGERDIRVTQEALAKMVGVSRPWLNSILSDLEHRGLIQRHRQRIRVLSMPDLRTFLSARYKKI